MSQSVLFFIIVLVIVFAIMVSSYIHKRHHEFNMDDIERAVRGAYPKGVRSIGKSELVDAVKKYFHCSSKDAHYIIGVARQKRSLIFLLAMLRWHKSLLKSLENLPLAWENFPLRKLEVSVKET